MINKNDDNDSDIIHEDDDNSLWQYVTKGITPIDRSTSFRPEPKKSLSRGQSDTSPTEQNNTEDKLKSPDNTEFQAALKDLEKHGLNASARSTQSAQDKSGQNGFDKRTDERLRRGQIPIEARIDLHGYNKDQAKGVLTNFIKAAHGQGKRCVLVITGKGSRNNDQASKPPAKGVLRTNVPHWLNEPPLSDIVIKHYPSKPKDGGDGALYVYLRRHKKR